MESVMKRPNRIVLRGARVPLDVYNRLKGVLAKKNLTFQRWLRLKIVEEIENDRLPKETPQDES